MRVPVVNTGSTSLELRLLGPGDRVEATLDLEPWDGETAGKELVAFMDRLGGSANPGAAGHRVVHGGDLFTAPVLIDDGVLAALAGLADLAPLTFSQRLSGDHAVFELGENQRRLCDLSDFARADSDVLKSRPPLAKEGEPALAQAAQRAQQRVAGPGVKVQFGAVSGLLDRGQDAPACAFVAGVG